jgi:hypothetical protein
LTNKFARRFVMGNLVIIHFANRYVERKAREIRDASRLATARLQREIYNAKEDPDNFGLGPACFLGRPVRCGR